MLIQHLNGREACHFLASGQWLHLRIIVIPTIEDNKYKASYLSWAYSTSAFYLLITQLRAAADTPTFITLAAQLVCTLLTPT